MRDRSIQRILTLLIVCAGFLLVYSPSALSAAHLVVHAECHPGMVTKGKPTEVHVRVVNQHNHPVPNARVRIQAGGGFFHATNNTSVVGHTGPGGEFAAPWHCSPCAGAYVFEIHVTRPGFPPAHTQARVTIGQPMIPAKPMKPLHPQKLVIHAGAHPNTVPPNHPTEIHVHVETPHGHPLPGAHIKIQAGGGVFPAFNGTIARGKTNPGGDFATPWRCQPCAGSYILSVHASKPGFIAADAQIRINIAGSMKPKPPNQPQKPGQIIVHAQAHPAKVPPGVPAEIHVHAETANGHPLPGARVVIRTGGGKFLNNNGTTIAGHTNAHGDYGTPWKCQPCAGAYVMDIEVTKPGFIRAARKVTVHIGQ